MTELIDEVMIKARREWRGGIVVFGLFVLVLGGVIFSYAKNNNQAPITNQQTITPNNQAPIINNQTIEPNTQIVKPVFAVWNGSGIAGAAGKMAETLKASGYEVVETKNAPKEQVGTTLELSETVIAQKEKIMQAVGVTDIPARPGLAGEHEYNVLVILGK